MKCYVAPFLLFLLPPLIGCNGRQTSPSSAPVQAGETALAPSPSPMAQPPSSFIGFDRNVYPGDGRLAELKKRFAFTGFWLNNPPGEQQNSWAGHRPQLVAAGFGFLVLWNGRLDAEIKHAAIPPDALGKTDAQNAIASAHREGFPAGTIVFLDQEEGGRLLPEQAAYFFGFTETLAASPYRAGAYLSGQPSGDGPETNGRRATVTTAADVDATINARHLHPVVLWAAQDSCPPAPGCTVAENAVHHLNPTNSGTLDASVWQFAQSPQRPGFTHACASTYAKDGNCYAGISPDLFLDLDVAGSPDPSHGR